MMRPIKTLLACWDEATDTALATLGEGFQVTVVHRLDEVKRLLELDHFNLIVATIRFDESRPLELLPLAARFTVPVALVRFGVSQLSPEVVSGVFVAARSLGCGATLDLAARSKVIGAEAAIAELRIALRAAAHRVVG